MGFTNFMWLIIVVPLVSSPSFLLFDFLRALCALLKHDLFPVAGSGCGFYELDPLIGVINEMRAGLPVNDASQVCWVSHVTAFSLILSLSTLTLGTLAILFSGKYLSKEEGEEKFYALFSLMMGSHHPV